MRWNFDRIRKGRLMAEGIAVHAKTLDEAMVMACALNGDPSERLIFRDNATCRHAQRRVTSAPSRENDMEDQKPYTVPHPQLDRRHPYYGERHTEIRLERCDRCGEVLDDVKRPCPGCGHCLRCG